MADTTSVLKDALALDERGRAEVAAALVASLDAPAEDPAVVEAAWAVEIERRAERALTHPEESEDWVTVRQRLLGGRRG